jgi:phosphoglycolate phosphatase-like HAD superfamily hydrolase
LATNKREIPTQSILAHLGWTTFFADVYCLDAYPTCFDKEQLLGKLLSLHHLKGSNTPYIGDTEGDATAATRNKMPYIHVGWGYGSPPSTTTRCSVNADQLLALIKEQPWT